MCLNNFQRKTQHEDPKSNSCLRSEDQSTEIMEETGEFCGGHANALADTDNTSLTEVGMIAS